FSSCLARNIRRNAPALGAQSRTQRSARRIAFPSERSPRSPRHARDRIFEICDTTDHLMFKKIQHIHFVGIGGSGMSGIAEVLLNLGYKVSGSDLKATTVTDRLEKLGVKIAIGHRQQNIEGIHGVDTAPCVH